MNVVAIATPFTISGLHEDQIPEHAWVVHELERLIEAVTDRIAEQGRTSHSSGRPAGQRMAVAGAGIPRCCGGGR